VFLIKQLHSTSCCWYITPFVDYIYCIYYIVSCLYHIHGARYILPQALISIHHSRYRSTSGTLPQNRYLTFLPPVFIRPAVVPVDTILSEPFDRCSSRFWCITVPVVFFGGDTLTIFYYILVFILGFYHFDRATIHYRNTVTFTCLPPFEHLFFPRTYHLHLEVFSTTVTGYHRWFTWCLPFLLGRPPFYRRSFLIHSVLFVTFLLLFVLIPVPFRVHSEFYCISWFVHTVKDTSVATIRCLLFYYTTILKFPGHLFHYHYRLAPIQWNRFCRRAPFLSLF